MEFRRLWTLRPTVEISFNTDYAEFVNDGTRPHVIRPKRAHTLRRSSRGVVKPALRFVVGGRVVFARVVHHPGTRPNPFLDRAVREIAAPKGYRVTNG